MLNHLGTKELKTARLTLRRFTIEDAFNMYNNWANDERVTRFLTWTPHSSVEETKALLKIWIDSYQNQNFYNWVIEFDNQIIGNISVVSFDDKSEYCELGYCLGYNYWNKGIMSEATKKVIEFLFEEVKFNRIEIKHAQKNPASGRVAQKCGFKCEGIKREFYKSNDGEFLDIVCYSILKREYK